MKSDYDTTYLAQRDAFRNLCADFAPPNKKDQIALAAADEFDRLVKTQIFPQVAIREGLVLARTRFVWIPTKDKVYRLGEYLVEIGEHYFSAHNLTKTVSEYHHPHINAAGNVCMRDGREEIMQMIKEGWLARAMWGVESALWIVDTSSQYPAGGLEKWPVEPDGKEKGND